MSSIFAQQADPSAQMAPQPMNYDAPHSQAQYAPQHAVPNHPQNGPGQLPNPVPNLPPGSSAHINSQPIPTQTTANSGMPSGTTMAPPASIQKVSQ